MIELCLAGALSSILLNSIQSMQMLVYPTTVTRLVQKVR